MKIGTEDRKKLILAGSLGVAALSALIYQIAGSGSDAPAPTPAPVTVRVNVPNPVARVSRSALDPTLHPEGMLATEALVYSGSGRNIFSGTVEAPAIAIPRPIAAVRTQPAVQPPAYQGPPPPAPIDLRFFGTVQHQGGKLQAFFLKGDDVFLASEGDIVSHRYRVGTISANSAQVTDLTSNNTQTLPLVAQ